MKPQPRDAIAAKAKAALALVEKLTDEIEKAIPRTRDGWRAYGQALLDAKQVMPNTQTFGAWVKANGLDTGLAANKSVRSNAQWVARYWTELQACNWLTQHHPTDVRRAYLAWQEAQVRKDRKFGSSGESVGDLRPS